VLGAGCEGLTIITFRLGVDGSLTPWARAPGAHVLAVIRSVNAVRTSRFMKRSPKREHREAITVPSRLLGSSLPRHGDQLAVSPDPLSRHPARQLARRQDPGGCGSRGALGRLGFLRRGGQDAGARQIGLVLGPLCKRRLHQKSHKRECYETAAHDQNTGKRNSSNCHSFLPKSKPPKLVRQGLLQAGDQSGFRSDGFDAEKPSETAYSGLLDRP
jgi:hypothetical protein